MTVLFLTDCFSSFSLAISSFRPEEDDRECFWVVGAVFHRGLIAVSSIDPFETIASGSSIVRRRRPRFYLRLAHYGAAISLIRVMRGGLWLGECLGRLKAGPKLWPETSLDPASRIHGELRASHPHPALVPASERYVACIFSFVASNVSPLF